MADVIVTMHATVKGYINSAENRNLATEIGSEVLELTRTGYAVRGKWCQINSRLKGFLNAGYAVRSMRCEINSRLKAILQAGYAKSDK